MMFRFHEGDEVILRYGEEHSAFLPNGSRGIVFCRYASDPPAYEVNFRDGEGREFGSVVLEEEIERVPETVASNQHEAVRMN